MTATFWIETVFHRFLSPPFTPGQPPLRIQPEISGYPVPTFVIDPQIAIMEPIWLGVTSTQIQYSQKVMLRFNGIVWPHVSVATLVPSAPIPARWYHHRTRLARQMDISLTR